jgi:hypothetical protein
LVFTRSLCLLLVLAIGCLALPVVAQQGQQPLTNDDVVKMVKSGLPTGTIVGAIQANESNFDVSANGLIALHKAGVTQPVMDAMIASASKKRTPEIPSAAPASGATSNAPVAGQFSATVSDNGKQQAVQLEKTQLAQTKTKASSLGALSADSALNQTFQAGVNTAAWAAWQHGGGYGSYAGVSTAGNVMSGIMGHRKPSVTYVWALPGPSAATVLGNSPTFDVAYSGIPGVNADEYEPQIIKLTATTNNWRLIGASQGKEDSMQDSSANWDVYSSFVEDKVPARVDKTGSGHAQITPATSLAAGQYGVVLRPRSKGKRFAGTDLAGDRGEGMIFDSVFAFGVK